MLLCSKDVLSCSWRASRIILTYAVACVAWLQCYREEAARLGNTIADLRGAMNQSEERLSQRLEVKEKVSMLVWKYEST
jgi:hypothetical protein